MLSLILRHSRSFAAPSGRSKGNANDLRRLRIRLSIAQTKEQSVVNHFSINLTTSGPGPHRFHRCVPPPPPPMNQKPGKANFRELVSKKIPGGACPRAPLEACSLGPLFRKSVSIYPRSAPVRPILTVRGRRGDLSIFICFARLIVKS